MVHLPQRRSSNPVGSSGGVGTVWSSRHRAGRNHCRTHDECSGRLGHRPEPGRSFRDGETERGVLCENIAVVKTKNRVRVFFFKTPTQSLKQKHIMVGPTVVGPSTRGRHAMVNVPIGQSIVILKIHHKKTRLK